MQLGLSCDDTVAGVKAGAEGLSGLCVLNLVDVPTVTLLNADFSSLAVGGRESFEATVLSEVGCCPDDAGWMSAPSCDTPSTG